MTRRLHSCWPLPHEAVQVDHSAQSFTAQSLRSQGAWLQPRSSMSSEGHILPPASGFLTTWRCLVC